MFWNPEWLYLILDTDIPAINSWSLNLTSLKDDDDLFLSSLAWGIRPDKLFFIRLLISELLLTKFLWSPSMSYYSNRDFSSSWGPKFPDALLSSPRIGVSCLSCICIRRAYWLIRRFIYLVSPCIDFILFLHPGPR